MISSNARREKLWTPRTQTAAQNYLAICRARLDDRKKDGTYRFAVDLRKLNQITAENGDDVWLLPRIDECLRRCDGMTWFTCIDARSAFWSIPLARSSRRYTAFSTPVGSYF